MNEQIYEEASDWIVKHRSDLLEANERLAFDRWLRQSPLHVRAYLEMSSVWEGLGALKPGVHPQAEVLIAQAQVEDGVVAFAAPTSVAPTWGARERAPQGASPPSSRSGARQRFSNFARRRAMGPRALAACLVLAVAWVGWLQLRPEVYRTGIGEQRSLTLEDGSTVTLNARSRIKVRYTEGQRSIDLLEGQALFQVAKNPQRPFVVKAGDARVQAVGTAFDVRRARSGTVVTVVEGRVAVNVPPAVARAETVHVPLSKRNEALLGAGEQVVVTQHVVTTPEHANVANTLAWTRRSLVLATASLPDVADELNRYAKKPWVIQDPTLTRFHVSGVFSTTDSVPLLQFLRTQPELIVEETDTEIRVRRK